MMRMSPIVATLSVAAAFGLLSLPAQADCTDGQIIKLHQKRISIAKIADRCEMSRDDVAAIIADHEAQPEDDQDDPNEGAYPPPRQAYCCDGYGNSRCAIVSGATALGASCFCPGQGYGWICR